MNKVGSIKTIDGDEWKKIKNLLRMLIALRSIRRDWLKFFGYGFQNPFLFTYAKYAKKKIILNVSKLTINISLQNKNIK